MTTKLKHVKLPMSGPLGSTPCYERGSYFFYEDGLFRSGNRAFENGVTINCGDEVAGTITRERGIGKPLYIRRPDDVVQTFRYVRGTWYELLESDRLGLLYRLARMLCYDVPLLLAMAAGMALITVLCVWYCFPDIDDPLPPPKTKPTVAKPKPSPGLLLTQVGGHVNGMGFTSDVELVSAAGPSVSWWDVRTGRCKETITGPGQFFPPISCFASSPYGDRVAVIAGYEVFLWNSRRWLARPERNPNSSPSYDPHTQAPPPPTINLPIPAPQPEIRLLAFSPNEGLLAAAGGDLQSCVIQLLSTNDLTQIGTIETDGVVVSIAFSPDGQSLACATRRHRVQIFDVATRRELIALRPPPFYYRKISECRIAFSPVDGHILAVFWPRAIHLLNVSSGTHLGCVQLDFVEAIAFSPTGLLAALTADGHYGELVLINTDSKHIVASLSPAVYAPRRVAFSPNGELIAIAGSGVQIIRTAEALTCRPRPTEPEMESGFITDFVQTLKEYFQ